MRRRVVTDVLVGGTQVLGVTLTAPLGRRRYNRWGATDAEVADPMPGDELVTHPMIGYTRAISIGATPEHVWPWLVQMGQGRGGLYSFDGLENLVGCDIHSADRVLAEFQDLGVGDLIRLGPPGYPCFRVHHVESCASLVLVGADPRPPHPAAPPDSTAGTATWQWQLRRTPDARGTRLITRQRLTYPPKTGPSVMWHLVEPVGFVMERQMLRTLKERVERGQPPHHRSP
ncbi:MAG: SRPBCC family protein [Ornithinibacter sp.]